MEKTGAFGGLKTSNPRPNIGVAGILLRNGPASIRDGNERVVMRDREIFLIRRTGSHGEGTWSVPGGWIEHKEGPDAALIREMWEEVGIRVEKAVFVGFKWSVFPGEIKTQESYTLWYEIKECEGEPYNSYPLRVAEARWGPIGQLPTPLFGSMQEAVDKGLIA